MSTGLDEDTLVAYADGALDDDARRAVERALVTDAAARETLRALRDSAATLRAALDAVAAEPIPLKAVQTIDAAFAARRNDGASAGGSGRRGTGLSWPVAIAASVLALVVGLGGGQYLAGLRSDMQAAHLQALEAEDRVAQQAALQDALERQLSGASVAWRNANSGRQGAITPVRTFRNVAGQWCREYVASEGRDGDRVERRGIACRVGEGEWRTRLIATNDI